VTWNAAGRGPARRGLERGAARPGLAWLGAAWNMAWLDKTGRGGAGNEAGNEDPH